MEVALQLGQALKPYLTEKEWQWLSGQVHQIAVDPRPQLVAKIFTAMPRHLRSIDKTAAVSMEEPLAGPSGLRLPVKGWPVVRVARAWTLTGIPAQDRSAYISLIERLFQYGEMEELVALYAALPLYHYPEAWQARCTEGVRSNIGPVRQAVMLHNPYPSRFLEEGAWNQLVLKAFFTDEYIPDIIGVRERNNLRLAQALVDYAYERHAAKREIDPMLWVLVTEFLDERAFGLMKRVFSATQSVSERKAISYAFKNSAFGPAVEFFGITPLMQELAEDKGMPWEGWVLNINDNKNYGN